MNYYRLGDDHSFPSRWYLGTMTDPQGREVDPRTFTSGELARVSEPVRISKRRDGQPMDFTLGDFDVPVASCEVARVLQQIAKRDLQLVDAIVEAEVSKFSVLNVLRTIDCIDAVRSEYIKWNPEDGRPDKVGQYKQITQLRIDPMRVGARRCSASADGRWL
jgi:hypothetical protein